MHGDDVASAGTQISKEAVSSVVEILLKIYQAHNERKQQEKRLKAEMELRNPVEMNGEQKTLSQLKKGGEITSVKLSKEDFEAFKKINDKKYGGDVAFTAIKNGSEYVDVHFLKSDEEAFKNICNEVVANKLENSKDGFNMTIIPKEKAETLQQVCADNNISVSMMETPNGEIKCIYDENIKEKVKAAVAETDQTFNSLSSMSAAVKNDNGRPKITITDTEQNKSITMNFSDKQRFERALQEQFGFNKAKAIAASSSLLPQLSEEQKRRFLSGSVLTERIDTLENNIRFKDDSILVKDYDFKKIKLKDYDEPNIAVSDKDGNTVIIFPSDSQKEVENKLKNNLNIDSKEKLDDMLKKTEKVKADMKEYNKSVGTYEINRLSRNSAEVRLGDRSATVNLSDKALGIEELQKNFGMSESKAEKIIDKAKNQSVTKSILSRAKANAPKTDTMIKDKKPARGSRK